jgi:hypothetical protein
MGGLQDRLASKKKVNRRIESWVLTGGLLKECPPVV